MKTQHLESSPPQSKLPLHLPTVIRRLRKAVEPFPKAAMFQLAAERFDSVFEHLVACTIPIRTFAEVPPPPPRALSQVPRPPQPPADLSTPQTAPLTHPATFH